MVMSWVVCGHLLGLWSFPRSWSKHANRKPHTSTHTNRGYDSQKNYNHVSSPRYAYQADGKTCADMKNAKSEPNLNTCENVKTLQELLEVSGVRTAPRRRLSMNTTADQDRACFAARYCCRHPKKAPKTRGCNDLPIAVKAPRRSRANHSVSRRKASACFCCSASQRSSRCRVTSCCKTARRALGGLLAEAA